MLVRVRRDQGDALTLPVRWQVSIRVTPITAASGLPLTRGCPGRQLRVGGVTSAPGRPRLPGGISRQRGSGVSPPFPRAALAPTALLLGDRRFVPFPVILGAKVALRLFYGCSSVPRRTAASLPATGAAGGAGGVFLYLSIVWVIALPLFPPLPNQGNCPSRSWCTGKGIGLVGFPGSASSNAGWWVLRWAPRGDAPPRRCFSTRLFPRLTLADSPVLCLQTQLIKQDRYELN